ncbi:hypothetical protein ACFX13_038704 [Malus domestica]
MSGFVGILPTIAALIKKSHPDWSPTAIKYAIMTTTDVLNLVGTPIVDQRLNPWTSLQLVEAVSTLQRQMTRGLSST